MISRMTRKVWDVAGDYTWVCPPGVTCIILEMRGGAGGGSGSDYGVPGFGGGGACSFLTPVEVTPGQTYQVTVGRGGIGTTGYVGGEDGYPSSFGIQYWWPPACQASGAAGGAAYGIMESGQGVAGGGAPYGDYASVMNASDSFRASKGTGGTAGDGGSGAPGDGPGANGGLAEWVSLPMKPSANGANGVNGSGGGGGGMNGVDYTLGGNGGNGSDGRVAIYWME